MVELSRGTKPAARLIDLTSLESELRFCRTAGDRIEIGALTTHNDVLASAALRADALPLVQACLEVGAPAIRTRGTIAGNVVTSSPANDTITALVALDATIEVASVRGRRRIPIATFCTGFRTTALAPDELVTSDLDPASSAHAARDLPQARLAPRAGDRRHQRRRRARTRRPARHAGDDRTRVRRPHDRARRRGRSGVAWNLARPQRAGAKPRTRSRRDRADRRRARSGRVSPHRRRSARRTSAHGTRGRQRRCGTPRRNHRSCSKRRPSAPRCRRTTAR